MHINKQGFQWHAHKYHTNFLGLFFFDIYMGMHAKTIDNEIR